MLHGVNAVADDRSRDAGVAGRLPIPPQAMAARHAEADNHGLDPDVHDPDQACEP